MQRVTTARHFSPQALIGLLEDHAPARIEELRKTFVQEADLLAPGRRLGADQIGGQVLVELARIAVPVALGRVQANIDWLRQRLRLARAVKMIGTIITAASSAGIVTSLVNERADIAVWAAGINFFAACAAAISSYYEAPLIRGRTSPAEMLEGLIETNIRLEQLAPQLGAGIASTKEELETLAIEANRLVSELRRVEMVIGTRKASTATW